ncbi:hypothetical protein CISIN_1g035969mg [Citrus sinensis]|uniref:Uncharacterized protein n=1 Tax=Citrus sinensis TaxID=2711 RepID=A0A067FBT9_CITSI|nr:hypothetical protein CISIN_1g035969mg [Citrus sinensis]
MIGGWMKAPTSPMAAGAKWGPSSAGVIENDTVMGRLLFQKSGAIDFMQNCDLPPPLKVFSGPGGTVISSMNRFDVYCRSGGHEREKLELLKALRLSQTRAREAEKRAASLAEEIDFISKAMFQDSLRLLAYRHWTRLLEFQVSKLHSQSQQNHGGDDDRGGDDGIEASSWFMALAFCLGIMGVVFSAYFF